MKHALEQTMPRGPFGHEKEAASERILIADDDPEMTRLIASTLRKAGYQVTSCATGINVLEHLGPCLLGQPGQTYSLVISDIRMPGVTGMELLEELSDARNKLPMILITGFGDVETHRTAARWGAVAVLDKPFDMSTLLNLVRRTLARQSGVSTMPPERRD